MHYLSAVVLFAKLIPAKDVLAKPMLFLISDLYYVNMQGILGENLILGGESSAICLDGVAWKSMNSPSFKIMERSKYNIGIYVKSFP